MKKIYLVILLSVFAFFTQAQTTIINPVGDGGFENGATFTANGWTVENYATANANKWFVGAVSTPSAGANAAYISDNATGTTYNYLTSSATRVLFWRDVTFPAGETVITLAFKLKVTGEATYDDLTAFVQNSATVPTTGTQPASSGSSSATIANTTRLITASTGGASYVTYTANIVAADAGNAATATTRRIIFLWENDASGGTQPPASIDEISLTTATPAPLCNSNGAFTIDNTLSNNATAAGGNFSSFTNAVNYINANGICGALTFNVAAGQNFSESVPALTATGTMANTITFLKSGAGANPKIVVPSLAGLADFGFCIAGGDYITIDGIDILSTLGAGIEYGFLVRNASATDGAQNNTIKNTTITLSRSGSNSIYGIYQTATTTGGGFTPTANSGANSFNKYQNFSITGVRNNGIYLLANGGFRDVGCEIGTTDCSIRNTITNVGPTVSTFIAAYGIQTTSQENCKIYNTDISAVAGNQSTTYGIYMALNNGNCEIYKNKVQDVSVLGGTSITNSAYGIRVDQPTTLTHNTKIYNNFVSNLYTSRTTANATRYVFGIFVGIASAAATQSYNIENNSVSIGQGLNTAISSSCFEVQNNGSVYILRNNIFANFTAAQGVTAKHYCVKYTGATWGAAGSISNYNDYFVANDANVSGFVSQVNTTNNATLALHATALTSPASQDVNSVSTDPVFINNNTNLHSGATNLNGVGLVIAGITDDIDCEVKNVSTPDIGADEFNVSALDMGATALVTPASPVCNNAAATVTVTIKNFGSAAIDFSVNPTTLTTNVSGAATATLTEIINTGTLAAGATQNVVMATTLNMAIGGTYTFNANTIVTGDGNATNDAMVATNRIIAATVALPQCIDFTGFTGANLTTVFSNWNEALGATNPTGTTSDWLSQTGLGGAGNISARINLNTNTNNDWIVGPKLVPASNTSLVFDAAITDWNNLNPDAVGMTGTDDNVKVKISTDCGATWTTLYTYDASNTATMITSAALTNNSISLAAYVGQNVILAFHASEGTIDDLPDYDFHIDNVCIKNLFPTDGSATTLALPNATQCYGTNETVSITFKNTGTTAIDFATNSLSITTNVTGATTATLVGSIIAGTLAPNATINLPMATTLDMSATGTYTFNATATLVGDADASNDAMLAVNRVVTAPTLTTTQPTSAAVTTGLANAQVLGFNFNTNKCGNVTQMVFNTNGTTNVLDIAMAKVFVTTTNSFSATTSYGTAVTSPSGSFTVTPTTALAVTPGATMYFWLVYDIACTAPNGAGPNVVDAELTSVEVAGITYTPTLANVNPSGTRAVSALATPTRVDGNGTTAVTLGTLNAPFAYSLVTGSAICARTVTAINFTATNANNTDIENAKAYYTTTSAFSNAVQFGTAITNPATGALSFTGSQLLAAGNNYFWVVYDISCTGTIAASINADINSLEINSVTTAVTGTATAANALAAIVNFTTVADGEWNNTATWQCGNVPTTNATSLIIAHNVTVSNTGNIGGSVTINTGKSLTINTGGELTLGTVGGGNRLLSNNGTLAISGGLLTVNGRVNLNDACTFNMTSGNLVIDPNNGVAAESVASGNSVFAIGSSTSALTTSVTGGTILINDPPFTGSGYSVVLNSNTHMAWPNSTIQFGGTTNLHPTTATYGFRVDCYLNSGRIGFGNVIINGNDVTKPVTDFQYGINAINNLTVNAGSELISNSGLSSFASDIINNGTVTGGLTLARITGLSSTAGAVLNAQQIGGAGVFRNLATSPTANLGSLLVNNTSTTGVTLNVPLSLSGTLSMSAGAINTTATNLLTLGYNATNTGTLSYTAGRINGPFKRWIGTTTGARQFPVGNATLLEDANINFTTANTTGGTVTATWIDGTPGFPNTLPLAEGALVINKTSNVGQWQLDAGDLLTGGTYTGVFKPLGNMGILDFAKTVLVKRPSAGGDWTLDGTHVITTGSNTAPILSRTGMFGFSQFAIGGELGVVLPISIEFFKGAKYTGGNFLDWKVTCTSSPTVELSLERSDDGRNFKVINNQTETAARCLQSFSYVDATPLSGANYYRLKISTPDGQYRYSSIVVILNKEKGFELISVAPNPVKDKAILTLTSAKAGKMEIVISDIAGKIVSKQSLMVIAGNNPVPLNVAALGTGTYTIAAINAEGETKATRFVKY